MIVASNELMDRIRKHWEDYDYERRKQERFAIQEQPRPVPFKQVPPETRKEIAELYKTLPASRITQSYNVRTNTVKKIARTYGVVKRKDSKAGRERKES